MSQSFLNNINELHLTQTELFHKSLQQNQLGHAYLFYGYEGVGKEAFAIELAAHLLCENGPEKKCGHCTSCRQMKKLWHPDFYYLFPLPSKAKVDEDAITSAKAMKAQNPFIDIRLASKNIFIGIEAIRELKNELYKHPQQGEIKIAFIQDVDTMRVEGANALLKILEEPPPYVYFILTTSKISRLLPTILSRCQLIHFDRPAPDKIHKTLEHYLENMNLSNLANSLRFADLNIKKALYFMNEDFLNIKNSAIDFFKYFLNMDWSHAHSILLAMTNEKDNRNLQLYLEFLTVYFFDLNYYSMEEISFIKNRELIDFIKQKRFSQKSVITVNKIIEVIIHFKDKLNSPFNFNVFLLMDKMFHKMKNNAGNL